MQPLAPGVRTPDLTGAFFVPQACAVRHASDDIPPRRSERRVFDGHHGAGVTYDRAPRLSHSDWSVPMRVAAEPRAWATCVAKFGRKRATTS